MLLREDQSVVAAWLCQGRSVAYICKVLECTPQDVEAASTRGIKSYVPSPSEIQRSAAKIRQGWSAAEEARRRDAIIEPLTITEIRCGDIVG